MLNLTGRELLAPPVRPFGRADYLKVGLGLMALKYAVDALLIYGAAGIAWTPFDYMLSLASLSRTKAASFSTALTLTLLIWTLPFIWIGVVLTVRRARDAGLPGWIVVAFFMPVVNYLLMAVLVAWPTEASRTAEEMPDPVYDAETTLARKALLAGMSAGVAAGVILIALGTLALRTYGFGVFAGVPFVIGAVAHIRRAE